MSRKQRHFLFNLNNVMSLLEKLIRHEALEMNEHLRDRVMNKDDWIQEYEIKLNIFFFLDERDFQYIEGGHNILGVYKQSLKDEDGNLDYPCLFSGVNYNTIGLQEFDDPTRLEFHCFIYHQLYNCGIMRWNDILRISKVSLEINVTYQRFLKI